MKLRVNIPFWLPLIFLHLVSSGYTLFAGYFIGSGYEQIGQAIEWQCLTDFILCLLFPHRPDLGAV